MQVTYSKETKMKNANCNNLSSKPIQNPINQIHFCLLHLLNVSIGNIHTKFQLDKSNISIKI